MSLVAATDLLAAVRAAGGDLLAEGDRLKVMAPQPLPVDLVERLRAAKPQLLAVLSPPAATWTDAEDERAAIVQEGTGAPREWCEALARLDAGRPPGDVPVARWRAFIDDAGRFIDGGWCARAIALGWGPLDLFGCDRQKPFARVDHAGLVWSLNGRKLIALADATAAMEVAPGVRQTYRRLPAERGGAVFPWQLIPP
jgi:hypothetical protein